ncbi:hypothetical protein G6O67_003442 [Ophiocordyceps sinensis]|uniref:Uncharacterized protein n=1 Tax=Ophiocordyceps sinensis TaxID=72228 RepID=A0A8H4V8C4_9HYPO|nr:hypothetical protein G6O67_003442 [Ophiocordyceps sinensis]
MKSFTALVALFVLAVAAAPARQAGDMDSRRRFVCPRRVQDFCRASNIHSGCTFGGAFRSGAMDTCRECTCV